MANNGRGSNLSRALMMPPWRAAKAALFLRHANAFHTQNRIFIELRGEDVRLFNGVSPGRKQTHMLVAGSANLNSHAYASCWSSVQ